MDNRRKINDAYLSLFKEEVDNGLKTWNMLEPFEYSKAIDVDSLQEYVGRTIYTVTFKNKRECAQYSKEIIAIAYNTNRSIDRVSDDDVVCIVLKDESGKEWFMTFDNASKAKEYLDSLNDGIAYVDSTIPGKLTIAKAWDHDTAYNTVLKKIGTIRIN